MSAPRKPYTDEEKQAVIAIYRQCGSVPETSEKTGVSRKTLHKWLDPEKAEKWRVAENINKKQAIEGFTGRNIVRSVDNVQLTAQEIEARKPRPHRDITALMFGDPAPGRSALDQRVSA